MTVRPGDVMSASVTVKGKRCACASRTSRNTVFAKTTRAAVVDLTSAD
jgi:hypothetical protein